MRRRWCSRGARRFRGSSGGRSVHELARVGDAELFIRPALLEHAVKVRLHDAAVTIFEAGEELEDGLARTIDEAARFMMRDGAITADQAQRELHDHPNPAEVAAFEERGVPRFRVQFIFE